MKTRRHDSTIQEPEHLSPWMTTEEAARYIGRDPGSLKRWRHEGTGPRFVVVNRQLIRYHIDDIDAFLDPDRAKHT